MKRIGPSWIDSRQREWLNIIKFAWGSTLKVRSQFMDGHPVLKMSFNQELGRNDEYTDTDFGKLGINEALEYFMQFSDRYEFVDNWQRVYGRIVSSLALLIV